MDYGKMAYLKAEELESRLSRLDAQNAREVYTDYTVNPAFDLHGGAYFISYVSASGSVFFFVSAVIRADSDIDNARFGVLVNGLSAGGCTFSAAKGETKTLFVMCSAYVNGTAKAELTAYNADCTLITCQLMLSGSGADIAHTGGEAATDNVGDVWAVVTGEDGYITARSFTEDNFALSDAVHIGIGRYADVAGGENNFAVCYTDTVGNTFVVMLDTELNVLSKKFVFSGAERAAICSYRDGFMLAGINDGGVELRYVDAGGGVSEPVGLETLANPTRVVFVKKANPPILTVNAAGRSYVRFALPEYGGEDVIGVTADVVVTGIKV